MTECIRKSREAAKAGKASFKTQQNNACQIDDGADCDINHGGGGVGAAGDHASRVGYTNG